MRNARHRARGRIDRRDGGRCPAERARCGTPYRCRCRYERIGADHDSYWRNRIQSVSPSARTSGDGVGVTRPSYGRAGTLAWTTSPISRRGGLSVERDPAANLVVTLAGRDPVLPAVATGSHMDSVPQEAITTVRRESPPASCLLRMKSRATCRCTHQAVRAARRGKRLVRESLTSVPWRCSAN